MSIVDEITRLTSAKADIKAAIEAKGVSVPSSATLDAFPSYVSAISGGGGGFTLDDILFRRLSGYLSTSASSLFQSIFATTSITGAYLPNVTYAISYAFTSCSQLSEVYGPKIKDVGQSAFAYTGVVDISFPKCEYVRSYAFASCPSLRTAFFGGSSVYGVRIQAGAFYRCASLESVTHLGAEQIDQNAFYSCSSLQFAHFPSARLIAGSVFYQCSNLQTVVLGSLASQMIVISGYAFAWAQKLESLYILGSYVASLQQTNAFSSTAISQSSYLGHYGSIFVPVSRLAWYQSSTNWVTFSSRFVGLTDEQIAALPFM